MIYPFIFFSWNPLIALFGIRSWNSFWNLDKEVNLLILWTEAGRVSKLPDPLQTLWACPIIHARRFPTQPFAAFWKAMWSVLSRALITASTMKCCLGNSLRTKVLWNNCLKHCYFVSILVTKDLKFMLYPFFFICQ